MPAERRPNDRRRRVVYTSQYADPIDSSAAGRREREKLREARQPTKAYGARVHRRLRGRWFSLVPVKRKTLCLGALVISSCVILLAYAHYAAVTWPSIIYRPEIARPLRVDQPDSFGRWVMCVMLAASSGASLLIYQLRRYRNDDFRGQYRLWRIVIFVMLAASVNSLVSVVDWSGSLLDLAFGQRVAFSGYDWLRIVLGLGGAVLALRMAAEVHRSRWAFAGVVIGFAFLALPEASKWQLFEVDNIQRWALVTSAPLLGYTTLFLGLVGYLRFLYREVRGIQDEETIANKWNNFRAGLSRSERESEDRLEKEPETSAKPKSKRKRRSKPADPGKEPQEEAAEESTGNEEAVPKQRKKRRWLGLRRARDEASIADEVSHELVDEELEEQEPAVESQNATDLEQDAPKRKKRFGLSWRKKKKPVADEDAERVEEAEQEPEFDEELEPEPEEPQQAQRPDDYIDPDEIDWDSLSKSERRRLRKKIKRQNRAA